MKNTLEGIQSRLNDAEKWISEQDDRVLKLTAAEEKK